MTDQHFDTEEKAREHLKSEGFKYMGLVIWEGLEHIWIEQWQRAEQVARMLWLGNVQLKNHPMEILHGAKVSVIDSTDPNYANVINEKLI